MDWSVITGDPAVNICSAIAFRTTLLSAGQITAGLADGVNRRQRETGNTVFCNHAAEQIPCLSPVLQFPLHVHMEYSACGIKGLQRILVYECILQGAVIIRRQLGAVCIIGDVAFMAGCPDPGKTLPVQSGETEGRCV